MPPNEADFEKEFEQALASYSDPADAGLPFRILTAIEAQQSRRRWLLIWGIAAPAIACLIIAFLLWPTKRLHEIAPASGTAEVSKSPSVVLPEQPCAAVAKDKEHRTNAPHLQATIQRTKLQCPYPERPCSRTSGRLPKLDQFPTPRPLSEQEKLLITFVAQTPPREQKAILEEQQRSNGPLRIAALSIQPIDINKQP